MLVWVRVFRVGTTPISIDHSSCQFELGPHLYWSAIFHVSLSSSFSSWDHTYIDRSFIVLVWVGVAPISVGHLSYQFESRPHLYRSTILLSICVQFELGPHLYRLVIILSVRVCVLGPHTYRSAIFLSFILCSVWVFRTAPISIGHCLVSLSRGHTYIDRPSSYHFHVSLSRDRTYIDRSFSVLVWVFEATPISIDHIPIISVFNLIRGRTYIDWPCSYYFPCSVWVGATPISIGHLPIIFMSVWVQFEFRDRTHINRPYFYHFVFSLSQDRTYIDWSTSCQFEFAF